VQMEQILIHQPHMNAFYLFYIVLSSMYEAW